MVLLVLLGGGAYVLCNPRWAFAMVVMLFPIKQVIQAYFESQRGWGNIGPNVAVALLAAFALGTRLIQGDRVARPFWNGATVTVLLLYVWATMALAWTPSLNNALSLFGDGLPYHILLLLVLPLLLRDLQDARRMLTGIMLVGGVVSVLMMLSPAGTFWSGRLVLTVGAGGAGGGRGNPLAMAELGGIMSITAVLIRYERAGKVLTILRAGTFVLGLGMAILSGTRGQVLGAALVGILFYPLARQVKNVKQFSLVSAGLLVLGAGLYGMFSLFIGVSNQQNWTTAKMADSVSDRWGRLMVLMNEWGRDPIAWLIGLGPNAFSAFWRQEATYVDYVHNVAGEALMELGLVGGLLFVGATYYTFRSGRDLWRIHRNDPDMRAAAAVLCGLSAYALILSLKQGCMYGMPAPFYWWLALACVSKAERLRAAGALPEESPVEPEYEPDPDAVAEAPLEAERAA